MSEISRIAYYLALIGGILLVIFGLLSLIGYAFIFLDRLYHLALLTLELLLHLRYHSDHWRKKRNSIVWAIVLIVVGIIGGGAWRTTSYPRRTNWTHCGTN